MAQPNARQQLRSSLLRSPMRLWFLGLTALAFLWFVWPSPYEYTRRAQDVWRVNRFTGVRERSSSTGWIKDERNVNSESLAPSLKEVTQLIEVEPGGFESTVRSFESGKAFGKYVLVMQDGSRYEVDWPHKNPPSPKDVEALALDVEAVQGKLGVRAAVIRNRTSQRLRDVTLQFSALSFKGVVLFTCTGKIAEFQPKDRIVLRPVSADPNANWPLVSLLRLDRAYAEKPPESPSKS